MSTHPTKDPFDPTGHIQELEAQLKGWRESATAELIEERDDARAELARTQAALGRSRREQEEIQAVLAKLRLVAGISRNPAGAHLDPVRVLTPDEVAEQADRLAYAYDDGATVRVMWDGGLKIDTSDGAGWSAPLGEPLSLAGVAA